jgi:hypothetical protein
LEQDGDLIILLHREDYYHYTDQNYQPTHQIEAIVAKSKSGPPAVVPLYFSSKFQRVTDWNGGYGARPAQDEPTLIPNDPFETPAVAEK